ncbi:hypothetical protein AQS8620_03015 [Aquimixticola soesokkakensis]|uniref:DUF1223 domain-containing protein n=1 Tax=Aquimixticola soesokkakensis TaxID=1519096 RepID=A0A1Y5TLZ1_9RHOB|nr:DUF1223 domain-containing protein [Aquimixticola soesokkakensis]SLN65338.1 hypothetical protein AQS8620_03015 [Aquimixticola soesokkakensis]
MADRRAGLHSTGFASATRGARAVAALSLWAACAAVSSASAGFAENARTQVVTAQNGQVQNGQAQIGQGQALKRPKLPAPGQDAIPGWGKSRPAPMPFVERALRVDHDFPVVVELYTSQGCSSCPPADAMLTDLAGRSDILALALHVDYWDYIGWKDAFGDAAFTDRQRAYAQAAGTRALYTPQFIVQGLDRVTGAKPMKLAESIAMLRRKLAGVPVDLLAVREGNSLHVSLIPEGDLPEDMLIQLVRYLPRAQVAIRSGENAGRTIDYTNVVTSWQVLGEWDGARPLDVAVEVAGDEPAAILLQAEDMGPILAARVVK